jgi:nucleoid DNA-binding protein
MKNIIDLIHIKTKIERDLVATVVTETLGLTRETLMQGGEVYWPGLCKFAWKKTTKGKKPKTEPEEKSAKGYPEGKDFDDSLTIEEKEAKND